jgi:hypothetical protein
MLHDDDDDDDDHNNIPLQWMQRRFIVMGEPNAWKFIRVEGNGNIYRLLNAGMTWFQAVVVYFKINYASLEELWQVILLNICTCAES